MPIPNTTDVGELIRFLKKDRPEDSQKQRLAIALSIARKNGADIKKPSEKKASFGALAEAYKEALR